MFRKKRPRQKQKQEEEQPMYPNYSPWGPPPGYGYGYPPPPPPMQPPQYVVMPPPPPPKRGGRRQQNDWMEDLQEQYWKDFRKKIEKADEKPKEKQFSKWEVMFFLTFGSMIIFPLQAFAYKTIVSVLKAIPY